MQAVIVDEDGVAVAEHQASQLLDVLVIKQRGQWILPQLARTGVQSAVVRQQGRHARHFFVAHRRLPSIAHDRARPAHGETHGEVAFPRGP
jgi:hypothetical protein